MSRFSVEEELRRLLPVHPAGSWQEEALCAEIGPAPFFPVGGGSGAEARRICEMCPVVDECREYAVQNFIRDGIWGKTSRDDRRKIWRERGMAEPIDDEESAA